MLATTDTSTATATTPILAEPARIRVVVADDHPLFRQGIVRALRIAGGFEIVAEAADGATALALIRRHEPDVAVVDVRMPGMDGIDVVAALARSGSDVPVVLLSAFDDEPLVAAGLEAGAAAYITKSADRDAICLEIAAAARARAARSPERHPRLPDLGRAAPPGLEPAPHLPRAPAAPARAAPAGTSPSSRSCAASTNPHCAAGSPAPSPSSVPTTSPRRSRSHDRRASSADAIRARAGRLKTKARVSGLRSSEDQAGLGRGRSLEGLSL